MRKLTLFLFIFAATLSLAVLAADKPAAAPTAQPEWNLNMTAIEACSCPMFCQCYFATKPAAHHEGHESKHFCRANIAWKVNKGTYGQTKLDGAKFWVASDLGDDFADGEMDWTVVTFDKSVSKDQRDAIAAMMAHVFPVKWKSMQVAEGTIDKWEFNNDSAIALLDGGKSGEIRLKRFPGNTNEPVVIKNLKYFGAPRNDGFVLMPNEVEAYRVGPNAFEFKGTNGFMITIDMNSKDLQPAPAAKSAKSAY